MAIRQSRSSEMFKYVSSKNRRYVLFMCDNSWQPEIGENCHVDKICVCCLADETLDIKQSRNHDLVSFTKSALNHSLSLRRTVGENRSELFKRQKQNHARQSTWVAVDFRFEFGGELFGSSNLSRSVFAQVLRNHNDGNGNERNNREISDKWKIKPMCLLKLFQKLFCITVWMLRGISSLCNWTSAK